MRALLVLLLATAAACGGRPAPAAPAAEAAAPAANPAIDRSSPEAFAEAVRARILAAGAARSAEPGGEALELAVITNNAHELSVNLHRVWDTCSRRAEVCEGEVDALIAAIARSAEDAPPVRANLLVLVRHREYATGVRVRAPEAWIEPFVGDLAIVYAFDQGDRFRIATSRDLAMLGLSRDEAATLALANLEARLGKVDALVGAKPGGLISNGTTLEPSLLLQREQWSEVASRGRRRLIASVPAADALVYVQAAGDEEIAKLRAASEQIVATAERPLSATVLVWSVDHWEPLPGP